MHPTRKTIDSKRFALIHPLIDFGVEVTERQQRIKTLNRMTRDYLIKKITVNVLSTHSLNSFSCI